MAKKDIKFVTRRKKFLPVEVPLIDSKVELIGNNLEEIKGRNIKLDLTRHLKGKSVEATLKVKIENQKAIAYPIKIKLMSFFIRRMMRKRISYVEDSFQAQTKESLVTIKPFLITRKKFSRAIRKNLRNNTKEWLINYIKDKKNEEIFEEILNNKIQKNLSLFLKKIYPLSLCEIREFSIKKDLEKDSVSEQIQQENLKEEKKASIKNIDNEKIKEAEKEIKKTQDKATKLEKEKIKNNKASDKKEEELN